MASAIKEKSFRLGLMGIEASEKLKEKRQYEIASQLLRAATSVGANVRESRSAQSRKDFAAKLGIARKECDETMYWLELLESAGIYENADMYNLAKEIYAILVASIRTTLSKD